MSAELGFLEIARQLTLIDSEVEAQSKISRLKLKDLSKCFEKPKSVNTKGLEIADLPEAVQKLLGSPDSKYHICLARRNSEAILSINNLSEQGKNFILVFSMQRDCVPFSFHFLQISGALGNALKTDSRYGEILAEKILSAISVHFV